MPASYPRCYKFISWFLKSDSYTDLAVICIFVVRKQQLAGQWNLIVIVGPSHLTVVPRGPGRWCRTAGSVCSVYRKPQLGVLGRVPCRATQRARWRRQALQIHMKRYKGEKHPGTTTTSSSKEYISPWQNTTSWVLSPDSPPAAP